MWLPRRARRALPPALPPRRSVRRPSRWPATTRPRSRMPTTWPPCSPREWTARARPSSSSTRTAHPPSGNDLSVFDKAFGLPAPPSLTVIQPAGPVPPYRANDNREGWAGETTLDVEYSHVMAPDANILLVETPTSENEGTTGFPEIETAEKYVINHHLGGVISQSFSATEQTFPSKQSLLDLRGAYTDAAQQGRDSAGRVGRQRCRRRQGQRVDLLPLPVTSWPDSDPLVTGVGGTQLHLNGAGSQDGAGHACGTTPTTRPRRSSSRRRRSEPAGRGRWQVDHLQPSGLPERRGVGGGQSARRSRHLDERGMQRGGRRLPELPRSAAGWYPTCGTSEATPLFAGVVALADQVAGHPLGDINPALYAMSASGAPGIVDVTSGNNTVSFPQGGTGRHRLRLQRGAGLRPGLGSRHGERRPLRPRTGGLCGSGVAPAGGLVCESRRIVPANQERTWNPHRLSTTRVRLPRWTPRRPPILSPCTRCSGIRRR